MMRAAETKHSQTAEDRRRGAAPAANVTRIGTLTDGFGDAA